MGIGIDMSVEIATTIMSALGLETIVSGTNLLHNMVNNLLLEDKDNIKIFKEELQHSISSLIYSENIESSVQELVKDTFAKCFSFDDLLKYRERKNELIKKLLNNWGNSQTIDKDYAAFEKLIKAIVSSLYENLHIFETTGKLTLEVLKDTTEIKKDIEQLTDDVKYIKEMASPRNEPVHSDVKDNISMIADDNEEYIINYTRPLFMEEMFDDNCIATLENMFTEPILSSENVGITEKLIKWRLSKNKYKYANNALFLLYGKAGTGKSSFTSHIISKEILGNKCHAVMLRKHVDKLNHKKVWESVKGIYKCYDDNMYKDTVLILDGLDEICVLQQDFDGKAFIENLADNVPNGVKILITSRSYEGYFRKVEDINNLTIDTIIWTDKQIENWCDSYALIHERKRIWCTEFIRKCNELDEHDKRKEIFCIPVILYICCVNEIDIELHNSVAGIYDTAFKKIGGREYARRNRSAELKDADKRLVDINWQYTKELAYQMFLNDTLESALNNNLVKAAQAMTARICNTTEHDIRYETERYYAVFHFVSKNTEGIEFAHKTVAEYFTAVKLYEDYFANTLTDMSEESIESIWENIFQAFRYKKIPEDIMQYLVELLETRSIQNGDSEDIFKDYVEWRKRFINAYYKGMRDQLLWKMIVQKENYIAKKQLILMDQVLVSFRNLTWFLTMIDFDNSDIIVNREMYNQIFESFFSHMVNMDVKLCFWENLGGVNLSGADLSGADLSNADFSGANLSGANLICADLNDADLSRANLSGADLCGADLCGADLCGANLCSVDFSGEDFKDAYLRGADLRNADLKGADLNDINLSYANLNGANLLCADLKDVDLSYANLRDANLMCANLKNVDLSGADLRDANLMGVNLDYVDLKEANLKDADLTGAKLNGEGLS